MTHVTVQPEHATIPTFRFAPSPNGRLHLGHAYSVLLNESLARCMGGRFLVRMEDIDPVRCTKELAEACLLDLAWLGLRWEAPVRAQSQHMNDYAQAIERLEGMGLLYPCFCTRSEVRARAKGFDPDGAPLYSGTCRAFSHEETQARIARGEPYALRIDMRAALERAPGPHGFLAFSPATDGRREMPCDPALWGDAVISRKDVRTSYHLSVVWDDALQGVSHVVRGCDLEAATSLHVLLQCLLGLPQPLYHHHALLLDEGGEKLAKRRYSESLADVRARGVTAEGIRAQLGF